jgi:ectoine hydroxylase
MASGLLVFGIDDGIPTARMLGVIVLLDDVNEFNGPTWLIPGSYKEGLIVVLHLQRNSILLIVD